MSQIIRKEIKKQLKNINKSVSMNKLKNFCDFQEGY